MVPCPLSRIFSFRALYFFILTCPPKSWACVSGKTLIFRAGLDLLTHPFHSVFPSFTADCRLLEMSFPMGTGDWVAGDWAQYRRLYQHGDLVSSSGYHRFLLCCFYIVILSLGSAVIRSGVQVPRGKRAFPLALAWYSLRPEAINIHRLWRPGPDRGQLGHRLLVGGIADRTSKVGFLAGRLFVCRHAYRFSGKLYPSISSSLCSSPARGIIFHGWDLGGRVSKCRVDFETLISLFFSYDRISWARVLECTSWNPQHLFVSVFLWDFNSWASGLLTVKWEQCSQPWRTVVKNTKWRTCLVGEELGEMCTLLPESPEEMCSGPREDCTECLKPCWLWGPTFLSSVWGGWPRIPPQRAFLLLPHTLWGLWDGCLMLYSRAWGWEVGSWDWES